MKITALPGWAKDALDLMNPFVSVDGSGERQAGAERFKEFVVHIERAWPSLNAKVVPEIEKLRDPAERTRTLLAILVLARRYFERPGYFDDHRAAQKEVDRLNATIRDRARELAKTIAQKDALTKSFPGVVDDSCYMIEHLRAWHEEAMQTDRFVEWASVVQERIVEFLRLAESTSLPAPDLGDFMRSVADNLPLSEAARPKLPRKHALDWHRAVVASLHPSRIGVEEGFRLSGEAIANVRRILFGQDPKAAGVRKARKVRAI